MAWQEAASSSRPVPASVLAAVPDRLPDAVIITDSAGTIVLATGAVREVLGYAPGTLEGRCVDTLVRADLRDRHAAARRSFLDAPLARAMGTRVPLRAVRADGVEIPVDIMIAPVRDGDETYVLATVRDVSGQERLERRLADADARYRDLFESATDAVYITTCDGAIVDWNPAFTSLLGYDADELGSIDARTLYADPAERLRFRERIEADGSVLGFPVRLRHRGGMVLHCRLSTSVRRDAEGSVIGYHGIIHDVTRQVRREDALQRRNRALADLTHFDWGSGSTVAAVAARVARVAAGALDVDRVALWSRQEAPGTFVRTATFDREAPGEAPTDGECPAQIAPTFALTLGRGVVVTEELPLDGSPDPYFAPRDIRAVMIAPVRVGRAGHGVLTFERTDGGREWIDEDVHFAGSVAAVLASLVERRERRSAELEARESEARFRAVAEAVPLPLAIAHEGTGALLYANRHFFDVLGGTPEELPDRLDADCLYDDPEERDRLVRELEERGEVTDSELRVRRPDGGRIWISATVRRGVYRGEPAYFVAFHDITPRKEAELALARSEAHFRRAQRAALMGSWEWNTESGRLMWTEGVRRLVGVDSSFEPTYDHFLSLVHPEDRERVRTAVADALYGRTASYEVDHRIVRPDGDVRWVREQGEVSRDAAGEPTAMVGVALDITKSMELEAQVRQTQKMDAVGRLAGGIAHDFNNLLTALIGNLDLARLAAEDGDSTGVAEELAAAHETSLRGRALTAQLLAFSRRQVLSPTAVDLNALTRGVKDLLDRLLGERYELALELAPSVEAVLADRVQLEQVLMNLVVNARDAMPDGGRVTVRTEVTSVPEPAVHVVVDDDGPGIDPEVLPRIFEPFFTTKELDKGTGLGLSTVYGIVHQSGGTIEAGRAPGGGARFDVSLPVAASVATRG